MPEVIRVGHKGADLIHPGNTLESFDAALAAGVDMIEFDVLPVDRDDPANTKLVVCHDYTHDLDHVPTLEEALAHLATAPFSGLRLDVDMKLPGYEDRVLAALGDAGLLERTLISSMERSSLAHIRRVAPEVTLGWSVPKVKRDYTKSVWTKIPAGAVLLAARQTFPRRAGIEIRNGFCDAIMAYFLLITPRLVRTVHEAGGELYAWTVDDPARIAALTEMGVTGIITNDPRLFPERATAR